ncbi:MAG: secretin and TonB N-terminal domain-containing protein [Acidobacteriota bacterium]|nr:secretin and TonB N-terminal domain-containing protein [Acidobacteriota bacterium]MDQ5871564.1 secretin and TonB N-terminal domain-containing protein [Acidobacteriota bacterium]
MNTRSLFLVGLLVPAAAASAVAAPTKTQKQSRVRITRAEPRPLPSLGQDPALRRNAAGGYPAVPIGEPARRYTGEPISLDLKDADIRDVLLTFSRLARLNMVIDPDVRGSVTVRLEDVPWDQALEVILKVNGLGYVLEGNIVRVGAPTRF